MDSSSESWNGKIKPQLSPLSSLMTSFSFSLQKTFCSFLSSCSVLTATTYFVSKKSSIHLIYHFTTYELYIFFIFDLSYIFCLYFLWSFNYEDPLFSFDYKRARKLLNEIFPQSKQPFISSFNCDMGLDYVMFFNKSVKLELPPRVHLSWI